MPVKHEFKSACARMIWRDGRQTAWTIVWKRHKVRAWFYTDEGRADLRNAGLEPDDKNPGREKIDKEDCFMVKALKTVVVTLAAWSCIVRNERFCSDQRSRAQVCVEQRRGKSPGGRAGQVRRPGEGKERREDRGQGVSARCA